MNNEARPEWIIDTTDQNFQEDAVTASSSQLVLVDFWASWCQPCKLLMPNLEKAVNAFQGAVRLVKVNTEVSPETAQGFQISSIPMVYALLDGQPVDYFQGVIEAEEIERWIIQLQKHRLVLDADKLTDVDPTAAVKAWEDLLQDDGENVVLLIGKARALHLAGENTMAQGIIETLEQRGFLEPEAEKIKAMIQLSGNPDEPATEAARQRYAQEPTSNEAALELAEALAAEGQYEEAFQLAIDVYAADKLGVGKAAHQFLLTAFKALPEEAEIVHKYRRKLAMLMY